MHQLCQRPQAYIRSMFHMYNGEIYPVTLLCHKEALESVYDHFKDDVEIIKDAGDPDMFIAKVNISVGASFYNWVFGFQKMVQILDPPEIKNEFEGIYSVTPRGFVDFPQILCFLSEMHKQELNFVLRFGKSVLYINKELLYNSGKSNLGGSLHVLHCEKLR